MGGSSGGSSGAVSYPDYMEAQHETWLTAVAADIVTATAGASPYATATAYDPDCVLNATNYIISLFYDEVLAMTPATDWDTYYDAAAAKYTPATITSITDYTFSPSIGSYTFTPTITDYTFTPTITAYSFDDILTDAALTALVDAYQTDLVARRDTLKSGYKVGMLNIGAVVSSSFTLGDAALTAEVARKIADFEAKLIFENEERKLRYQLGQAGENSAHNANVIGYENTKAGENTAHNANVISYEQVQSGENTQADANVISYEQVKSGENTAHNTNIIKRDMVVVSHDASNRGFNQGVADSIMARDMQHLSLYQALSQLTAEANRIKIVAKGEEGERNLKFDAFDATWDLEMYQYGNNTLAGISGGTAGTTGSEVSTASSVIGGVMSGAAVGANPALMAATGGASLPLMMVAGGIAGLLN